MNENGVRQPGCSPVFSIAGAMPGEAQATWRTAMPDPNRDTLDAHGHVITKVEAAARAELAAQTRGHLRLRTTVLGMQSAETAALSPAA